MSNPREFRYVWVWDKRLASGYLNSKRRPLVRHEDVVVFGRGGTTYNPQLEQRDVPRVRNTPARLPKGGDSLYPRRIVEGGTHTHRYPTSIVPVSNANQSQKVHPTQKPVALFAYLVRTYTNPGDTVLDFCMGSGTTGVAALQEGRDFIGIEREASYYEISQRRIAAAQPPLFAAAD
jgi:site-specific DNA-methyltransferase (adenine-specific)